MPGLFSRRSKAKEPGLLATSKTYFGAVSSADIDRLGLSSPTPSTADAHLLPNVPSKDDLPPPPPKDASYSAALPAYQRDNPRGRQDARSTTSPLTSELANMNEFGQMYPQHGTKASTIGASSHSATPSYLSPTTASTFSGGPRLAPTNTLHSVSSRSQFSRITASSASAYESSLPSIPAAASKPTYAYGYTTEGWQDHLSAVRVQALLEVCGEQIRSRGLDNPLIFSSMALDLSPTNVASLIKLFSGTPPGQRAIPTAFPEEVRYANPHDLAAVIKWAFARMGRVLAVPVPVPGAKRGEMREEMVYVQQRGFLDFEAYNAWREQERTQQYPATAFSGFLSHLGPENVKLLCSLFSLLSSTASYSLKNGMMPAKLSKHFGPLLFGLPEDETFARTYDAYVRASNATEHLLLAYIRFQATTTTLPPRLAQHISGYPSMLSAEMTQPSGSSKLVPVTQIERNVRLYSVDLVQSACEIDLSEHCPEWQDCRDTNEALGKDPQLSDKFRKLVNLRGGAVQGRRPGSAMTRDASAEEDDALAAHSSLVSKQWGDFLSGGFAAPDSSKLTFDLNESARRNRTTKRETVHWNEFSKAGFQGEDNSTLADALSFDDVLKQDVQNWPAERDQLHAKLKARQDKLPAFDYDTTPRLVTSPTMAGASQGISDNHPISRMDETFADVWADYLLGSGWSNRDELTHRSANFVVVQYKSRPNASTVGSQSAGSSLSAPTRFQVSARKDESVPKEERVDAAWFVIQEVVPAQYRADLEAAGRGTSKGLAMIRKFTMFRSRKDKEKLNGNGSMQEDASIASAADDVFRPGPGGSTKRILLSDQLKRNGSKNASQSTIRSNRTSVDRERPSSAILSKNEEDADDITAGDHGHKQFRSEGHQTGGGGGGGASKLISTLRAKSIRVVKSARRGASSPALKNVAAMDEFGAHPSAAAAAAAGNGARNGSSREQQGDVNVDRSFTSADYETRSVATDASSAMEDDSVGSKGAVKRKPSQLKARDGAKGQTGRSEDAWVDILVKANGNRMSGQDAPAAGARKTSLGLTSSRMDETAQLSVAEPLEGASTPRTGRTRASVGSVETYDGDDGNHGGPRSSTPPPPLGLASAKGVETGHGEVLERVDSRSSNPEMASQVLADTSNSRTANVSATHIPMRDASLRDASHLYEPSPPSSPPPAPPAALKPAPPIDLVAAARAALKSRKEAPARPAAQIDTKKLVESLRAGLSPIEAVRASKERRSASPEGGKSGDSEEGGAGARGKYRDVFAKDPVAGRVADVASRFGGRAAAVGGQSGIPVLKKKLGGVEEKALPTAPVTPALPDLAKEKDSNGSTAAVPQRSSVDSTRDPDEIYPEDAASNFDPKDQRSTDSPLVPARPLIDAGEIEQLSHQEKTYTWRQRNGLTNAAADQDNDASDAPTRFAPYQPGMPLDNVLEESESVLSGSNNL